MPGRASRRTHTITSDSIIHIAYYDCVLWTKRAWHIDRDQNHTVGIVPSPTPLSCFASSSFPTTLGEACRCSSVGTSSLSLSLAVKLIGVKAFRPECCYCCWLRVYCSYISSLIRYLSFFFTFFYSSRFFFSRFIALTLFISSTEKFRRQWGYIYRHIKGDDVTKPEKKVKPKPKPDSFIFLFFILWLRVFKVIFFSNP